MSSFINESLSNLNKSIETALNYESATDSESIKEITRDVISRFIEDEDGIHVLDLIILESEDLLLCDFGSVILPRIVRMAFSNMRAPAPVPSFEFMIKKLRGKTYSIYRASAGNRQRDTPINITFKYTGKKPSELVDNNFLIMIVFNSLHTAASNGFNMTTGERHVYANMCEMVTNGVLFDKFIIDVRGRKRISFRQFVIDAFGFGQSDREEIAEISLDMLSEYFGRFLDSINVQHKHKQ